MSGTMKLVIAALIGASAIAGAGAVYVFVIAPPAVQHAIMPVENGGSATNAQLDANIRAMCQASGKDAPPVCKNYMSGRTSNR